MVVTQPELSHPSTRAPPVVQGWCEQEPMTGPSHVEHLEAVHVELPVHLLPQEPQLLLSFVSSTQLLEQQFWPEVVQSLPHIPQLVSVLVRSTQVPPHGV